MTLTTQINFLPLTLLPRTFLQYPRARKVEHNNADNMNFFTSISTMVIAMVAMAAAAPNPEPQGVSGGVQLKLWVAKNVLTIMVNY